jgi:hypothetical protein
MTHSRLQRGQVRPSLVSVRLTLAACAFIALTTAHAFAQLANNQTNGFGNNRLVTFTYLQNFDCVDQPILDLDFNGILAQSDPNEMQTPICQPVTEPTQDPTGGNIKHTAHLYVFVPMFSVDNDQNPNDAMACPNGGRAGELCGATLGMTLIKLFGFVPEAWKTHPLVVNAMPRPEPSSAWHLHDARFFGRFGSNAECAWKDRASYNAHICAHPQSRPRRGQ